MVLSGTRNKRIRSEKIQRFRKLPKPDTVTVVPRLVISTREWEWGKSYLENPHLTGNLPIDTGKETSFSKTRMVPIGACVAVVAVTVTLSERAHREERASPRKSKLRSEVKVRSENNVS